jgi:hypothetical protein
MGSTDLQVPVSQPEFGYRRAQFRPILQDEDTNGISATDFQDIMMQELDTLRAEPEPDDFLVQNAEALRREIEILKLQHLEAEFEGADDETIPQLAQEIRDNGKNFTFVVASVADLCRHFARKWGGRRWNQSAFHWCPDLSRLRAVWKQNSAHILLCLLDWLNCTYLADVLFGYIG